MADVNVRASICVAGALPAPRCLGEYVGSRSDSETPIVISLEESLAHCLRMALRENPRGRSYGILRPRMQPAKLEKEVRPSSEANSK